MSCYALPGVRLRRAREWHLYDANGRRYTDYCQANGSAVLGHRPRGLSHVVKNEISRGLWVSTNSPWPNRVVVATRRLLSVAGLGVPNRITFVHRVRERVSAEVIAFHQARVLVWRPFCDSTPVATPDILIPVVPWPFPGIPAPVCSMTPLGARLLSTLENDQLISPIVGAGLVQALSLLTAAINSDDRMNPAADMHIPPGYERNGIYMVPASQPETLFALQYQTVTMDERDVWNQTRLRAVTKGIVLPAAPFDPIIVPGSVSDRERAVWRRFWGES